jgi:hypothetical protein
VPRISARFDQVRQNVTLAPGLFVYRPFLGDFFDDGTQNVHHDGHPADRRREILRHFEKREDPRSPVNLQHPLVSVIIALGAVLAGAVGPSDIAQWAALNEDFLVKSLNQAWVAEQVLEALRPAVLEASLGAAAEVEERRRQGARH